MWALVLVVRPRRRGTTAAWVAWRWRWVVGCVVVWVVGGSYGVVVAGVRGRRVGRVSVGWGWWRRSPLLSDEGVAASCWCRALGVVAAGTPIAPAVGRRLRAGGGTVGVSVGVRRLALPFVPVVVAAAYGCVG